MYIIKQRYPLYYVREDHSELVEVPKEVFFEDKNGKIYSQFYKGQLISREVFDLIFGTQSTKVKVEEFIIKEATPEVIEETQEVIKEGVTTEEVEEIQEVVEDTKVEEVSQSKSKGKKKK